MDIRRHTVDLLEKVRASAPLVHNITNFVVMNSTANILLAAGASPVMAHAPEEVAEMTCLADALVLNIGTLQTDWVKSMVLAGRAANRKGIPVVLDPVGAGATKFRTETVHRIMREVEIAVLRGNASEVFSLARADIRPRGVDASLTVTPDMIHDAERLSESLGCILAVSGPEDIVTDGRKTFRVGNGHALMTKVTGIGCGLSAVTGAFCAKADGDLLFATAAALGYYGLCGDLAAGVSRKPGGFFTAFVDALYSITLVDIENGLRIVEV